jgi:hypothetical protein
VYEPKLLTGQLQQFHRVTQSAARPPVGNVAVDPSGVEWGDAALVLDDGPVYRIPPATLKPLHLSADQMALVLDLHCA